MAALKSFSARADIEAILAGRDAVRMDVPVLQPAEPFLDTAGEELRRRIFLTQSQSGRNMCLRPEFTIPVCLQHIESGKTEGRYGYVGTAFRQRDVGASEFLQAGIEDIGNADTNAADARSVADALSCLSELGIEQENCDVLIGDQAVFDQVLSALGLPSGWRLRLAHAFGHDAALEATLDRLAHPITMPDLPDPILQAAKTGDSAKLEELIAAAMDEASLTNAGGRTPAEVAKRLFAKFAQSQLVPEEAKLDMLRSFLSISVPLDQSVDVLRAFEKDNQIDLAPAIAVFEERNKALVAAGLDLAEITYNASFGRRLDYYTGLVYELRSLSGEVLVGGGRYDRLLPLLGARTATPGVGFSIWLDRIAEASA